MAAAVCTHWLPITKYFPLSISKHPQDAYMDAHISSITISLCLDASEPEADLATCSLEWHVSKKNTRCTLREGCPQK